MLLYPLIPVQTGNIIIIMNTEFRNPLPHAIRQALLDYHAAVEKAFGLRLREMKLFGSYARGEARNDSDVDVLLLVDGATWRDRNLAAALTVDVLVATGVDIAPLVMSPIDLQKLQKGERLLAREIDQQSIPL